jgi:hypothetical protein
MRNILARDVVAIPAVGIGTINRSIVGTVQRIHLVDWRAEVLLCDEIWAGGDVLETGILGWSEQLVVQDICDGIVGDQMVRDPPHCNADRLFYQAVLLEAVRIHQ